MINLLPSETKKQIRAARINVNLVKYLIFSIFAATFLALACATIYLFIINTKPVNNSTTTINQSDSTNYDIAKNQYDTLLASFTAAKPIVDQQIAYSSIITNIGAALPSGVILSNLSLSSSKLSTPLTLQLKAKSTDLEQKIKENFQNLPIFSNVTIQSSKSDSSDASGYPVSINLNTVIDKGLAQ